MAHPWRYLLLLSLSLACVCRTLTAAATRARDPFHRDRHVHAELVSVSPGSPGLASVVLEWQSFHNLATPVGADPARVSATASALGNGEAVAAYEAQYSASGSGDWVTLSDALTGLGDGLDPAADVHERQLVLTRADAGETISDGFFRLALSHAGRSLLDVEQRTVTPRIPFDASEAQMKAALEALELVQQVQVFRSEQGGEGAATGAYQWVIVFDRVVTASEAGEQEDGDLPLLTLYAETISAAWSGAGDQVAVQSLRERQRDRVVCAGTCRLHVAALPSGVTYAFRVRARFETLGWSEWSAASDPLQTPATRIPAAPSPPELVVATASRLKIRWRSPARPDEGLFPVLSYRAQQKCGAELAWTAVSDTIAPSLTAYTSLASLPVAPNTSCAFRVAAANANGQGPFSLPSPPFTTTATTPAQVEALAARLESLPVPAVRIEWQPPSSDGGSDVLHYDVRYREADSSTWIRGEQVRPTHSAGLQQWNFTDRVAWRSYTQYVVSVRAVNEVGEGAFRSSAAFLTPYQAGPVPHDSGEASAAAANTSSSVVSMSGDGAAAGNMIDRYYVHGTGGGGVDGGDGQSGAVLVFPVTLGGERMAERAFFFADGAQRYRVPGWASGGDSQDDGGALTSAAQTRVVAVDVYAWGAGGGSGQKYAAGLEAAQDLAKGGGGAFTRAQFAVSPGDWLDVVVGGGGAGGRSSGKGGANGGGDGGRGDFAGGGGGGASEVRINGQPVLVAAGGGGGGASDYCCAHGGAAGGAGSAANAVVRAQAGQFPDARSIPLDITASAGTAASVDLLGPRDEYHSRNVEGDNRDATGLPARHQHVDYGSAGPHADYSLLATGGAGADSVKPGSAGQASSFQYSRAGTCVWTSVDNPVGSILEIAAPLAAWWPTSGQRGRGGHGQDGKDAGGGGGGGFFGGGGGGAGIDGAGGGGGSSFVSIPALFQPRDASARRLLRLDTSEQSVTDLSATPVTSTSVRLRWQSPAFGFPQPLQGFTIEMANGSASEDFCFVQFLSASNGHLATDTTISRLVPTSTYRFRVRPMLLDGSGLFAPAVSISTPAAPTNEWRRVNGDSDVRSVFGFQEEIRAGIRLEDALPLRRLPSARRGHSLTAFDGHLYLFGGLSKGYACDRAQGVECVLGAGVNNELWRFDPTINTWIEVVPSSLLSSPAVPPPRERHTMAVVSGRLLLFGGLQDRRTDSATGLVSTPALNDVWELSPTSATRRASASLRDLEQGLRIVDGAELFTIGYAGVAPDMCVVELRVDLQITHACPHSLRIELLGPGPSSFPQRQQSTMFPVDSQTRETQWSDHDGFTLGEKRTTPTVPSARSYSVVLQTPESAANRAPCAAGTQSLRFSSTNAASLEPLSVFHQLSAAGGWTLSVSDTAVDGHEGALDSWDITFTVEPCVPSFSWKSLAASTTGTAPSPRFAHTAIVYQSSMFVYGGRSGTNGKALQDLYRLDYTAATSSAHWTLLAPLVSSTAAAEERRFHSGRSALLTPFGLLSVTKGLRSPRWMSGVTRHFDSGTYVGRKHVAQPRQGWRRLQGVSVLDADAATPAPRYWSSVAYTSTATGHRVFMFGGQDDTALMDDFWQLELALLAEQEPPERVAQSRQEICDWRVGNAAFFAAEWAASCGASSAAVAAGLTTECSLDDLLLFSWCREHYQTLVL